VCSSDLGLTLSGGQRQRLAIARALLRDPAILIMDEATSMIDSESESNIAAAVAEMSGSRTILIVAHRLTTIRSAKRIVVMDAGRIIDSGTHEELMERCGVYRDLAKHQLMSEPRP
jgi:ABC-type multidrug transport system fused ATPase/permease subunit